MRTKFATIAGLIAAILIASYFSLVIGEYHLHSSLFQLFGASSTGTTTKNIDASVLWQVRFPRLIAALMIGIGLGEGGALAQALFRNPLAEPTLIGISSGAVLGSVVTTAFGLAAFGSNTHITTAVVCALLGGALILWLAPRGNLSLILTGISISAVMIAVAGLAIDMTSKPGAQSITFWNFGSLSLISFPTLKNFIVFIECGIVVTSIIGRKIDIYSLGDASAHYLGLSARRFRYLILIAIALLVGSSVACVGSIAFLGLISPHIARHLVGPRHRWLIPTSGLIGALILTAADLAARTIAAPNEIPVGLFTSVIGAPILIFLIRSSKSNWGSQE